MRREKQMRRLTLLIGMVVTALALGGAPAAVAANPDVNHFTDVDSFTDEDFCGTGEAVEISVSVRGTEFLAPNQPVDYRNVTQGTVTFTNPENGATVTNQFAGPFSDVTISGDPAGIHTHEFTVMGLPEMFRAEHGGVLTLDAGLIVFRQVFNGDEFVSGEIVINRGPHPQAESDFTLFCEVMTEALGLG
jgi:hypothetical protein